MNLNGPFLAAAWAALALGGAYPPAGRAAEVDAASAHRPPHLWPDYSETFIPPNIGPLNFRVEEPGSRYRVRIHSVKGPAIAVDSRHPTVILPPQPWKTLLRANPGELLYFDLLVRDLQGQWQRFNTVTNTIAPEDIDGHLVYRLLGPLYAYFADVGIYQRDLQTHRQSVVLHNQSINQGCLNCHTFSQNRPDRMALNIREKTIGNPTLMVCSNQVAKIEQTMGYLSWHPSGRLLAFSSNRLSLFFHTTGETRDVFDADSNLRIYRVDSNTVVTPPPIAQPDRLETWPAWAHDGSYLYFCSGPRLPFPRYRQIRYDLMRIHYDIERDHWGELETLVSAKDSGLSAGQPRPSPDGRSVLFCLFEYGNFPAYRSSSDLYLLDLATLQHQRLDINSDRTESWHSWSSNSRWIVFSSKRHDGLFSRPYFSYRTKDGHFQKPFLLPQNDPAFYDSFAKNYNLPELIQTPVPVTQEDLARAALRPLMVIKPLTDALLTPGKPDQSEEDLKPSYQ